MIKDIKHSSAKYRKKDKVRTPKILEPPDNSISSSPFYNCFALFVHRCLYPLKFLLYLTTIDVRLIDDTSLDTASMRNGSVELLGSGGRCDKLWFPISPSISFLSYEIQQFFIS